MENFTGTEDYQRDFNPRVYLDLYYRNSCQNNEILMFALRNLHKTFHLGDVTGTTLIDIGSGPTIYQILAACEKFTDIICTDYTDSNRRELESWLKNDPGAFNWRAVIEAACEIEGNREKWIEKQETVRKGVKRVLKCDVTKSNPVEPLVLQPSDCLITSLCLEAACKDTPTFRCALKNITSMIKPGGHLVMITVLQETFYMVGETKFSCLYLEKTSVEVAVKEAGCSIKYTEICPLSADQTADCTAVLFLLARKNNIV
ncbi:indolethylamine N-methyltransferase [Bombina bombina]|uniref:indolethylamine N-methyltransferase n=1 Tax=Bombina bombina TaxID=8345 RepID=UPI00235AB8B8|nr:indolethylamine N-methyltransferase [Bombina bombina]